MMKVASLFGVGDLRLEERPLPVPASDEVLVKIRYAGICGSDIPRVFVTGTYHFPLVPGHEFSGVVENDPENVLTGKRVAIFPLIPCFSCPSCAAGEYATCEKYDYYGSRRDGGFAEYIAVKRWNLTLVPDGVDDKVAAMCEPMAVAHHVARKMDIQRGDRILIYGAGPIGLFLGEWCRARGAEKIYYVDLSEEKLAFAESRGFCRYRGGDKVNKVVEGSGVCSCLIKAINAADKHGMLVLLGNPAGDYAIPKADFHKIMRKELTVIGVWNSSYNEKQNDFAEALAEVAAGAFDPLPIITAVYPLEKINDAFAFAKNPALFHNKVLIDCGGNEK